MQNSTLTHKIRVLADNLEKVDYLPVRVKTIGHFPVCPRRAYLRFLLEIFPYAQKQLSKPGVISKKDLQELSITDFSPLSPIQRSNMDIFLAVRKRLPLTREIHVGDCRFQVQGQLNDLMENKEKRELRVIEYQIIAEDEFPRTLLKRAKFQARAKSWIVANYRQDVDPPSVAIINKSKRNIPFQKLVSFSERETRNQLQQILQKFHQPQNLEKNENECEQCNFGQLCSHSNLFFLRS